MCGLSRVVEGLGGGNLELWKLDSYREYDAKV